MANENIYEKVSEQNAKLFDRLKSRACDNPISSIELVRDYESIRELLSSLHPNLYKEFSIKTGRAISNICYDIKNSVDFKRLSEIFDCENQCFSSSLLFFLAHRGGLCNRLRAISALKTISDDLGLNFQVVWAETQNCPGGPLPASNFFGKLSQLFYAVKSNLCHVYVEDEPLTPWAFYDLFKNILSFSSWAEFNSVCVRNSAKILDGLIDNLSLRENYESFVERNQLNDYVAMHVRRTDFVKYFADKYPDRELPSLDKYITLINDRFRGKMVFCCTDDKSVRDYMQSALGNKICFVDDDFKESDFRQTSVAHAVMDLKLLSLSNYIIPTPGSSFSSYAVSISNAEVIEL